MEHTMSESTSQSENEQEEEQTEQERRNKEIEEETGAVVQTEHGERYRALVISNTGDRDEPTSV